MPRRRPTFPPGTKLETGTKLERQKERQIAIGSPLGVQRRRALRAFAGFASHVRAHRIRRAPLLGLGDGLCDFGRRFSAESQPLSDLRWGQVDLPQRLLNLHGDGLRALTFLDDRWRQSEISPCASDSRLDGLHGSRASNCRRTRAWHQEPLCPLFNLYRTWPRVQDGPLKLLSANCYLPIAIRHRDLENAHTRTL